MSVETEINKSLAKEAKRRELLRIGVKNPDKIFLQAARNTISNGPQATISKTSFCDGVLSSEKTVVGFEDEVARLAVGRFSYNVSSTLYLSDLFKERHDGGYLPQESVAQIQSIFSEEGYNSTLMSFVPDTGRIEHAQNLLVFLNGDTAVGINLGHPSENSERQYLLALAKKEKEQGQYGDVSKRLRYLESGLSNDAVTVKLYKNHFYGQPLASPDLQGVDNFKQAFGFYKNIYELFIQSLYEIDDIPLPESKILFAPVSAETKVEVKNGWLLTEEDKQQFPSFDEIGGQVEAVGELKDWVTMINAPEVFRRRGVKRDKGALLFGEPGNGKTLLAQAVARSSKAKVLFISCADLGSTYINVLPEAMSEIFETANELSAQGEEVLICFEEMDGIFASRNGAHEENKKVVNVALENLDGPKANPRVSVLGTTNRPDDIDPAIRRAGRIDMEIEVPKPDLVGRQEILQVHMDKAKKISDCPEELFSSDISLSLIAEMTDAMSGAQLAQLISQTLKKHAVAEVNGEEWRPVTEEDLLDKIAAMNKEKKSEKIGFSTEEQGEVIYN